MRISTRGAFALLSTLVLWSTPALFQYYLIRRFDTWTQNFYRYLFGFLTIAPLAWSGLRRGEVRPQLRHWKACLWPALPNVAHQVSQAAALAYLLPGFYAILGRISVIFTALLAHLLFPEERPLLRSWNFQAGTLLGLAGVAGLVSSAAGFRISNLPREGLGLTLLAAANWALYSVWVKKHAGELAPAVGFSMISLLTTLLLLPLMLLWGDA